MAWIDASEDSLQLQRIDDASSFEPMVLDTGTGGLVYARLRADTDDVFLAWNDLDSGDMLDGQTRAIKLLRLRACE